MSLKIYEQNNDLHIGIITYGDTVTIKVKTRNLIGETLEFEIWHDKRADNYTDNYSLIDKTDDNEMEETVSIPIDSEGNGEGNFCIPDSWKSNQKDKVRPEYYYFKYGKEEFPRAYYYKNPKLVNEKKKQKDKAKIDVGALSTDYIVHPRIKALMLKVADKLTLDDKIEEENAVILSEELELEDKEKESQCEILLWGSKVNCEFRKKLIEICSDLWGEDKKLFMANEMMACMYVETSGTFSSSVIRLVTKPRPNPKKGQKDTMRVYEGYSKEAHKKDTSLVNDRAVGLIQFTSVAAEELKISKQKLALMTEIEQLDYVKKYFEVGERYKKITNGQQMYLTIFCPASVHKDKDYVLYSKEKDAKNGNTYYNANKSIDEENNNDGKIQRSEAVSRVLKAKTSGISKKNANQCKVDVSNCTNVVYKGTEDGVCPKCGKKHVDIADDSKWISQYDNNWNDWSTLPKSKACYDTCKEILKRESIICVGLGKVQKEKYQNGTNKWTGVIQLFVQNVDDLLEKTEDYDNGIIYLDQQLDNNKLVIVGLDDGRTKTYNKDNTTEHFVVIRGRKCVNGKVEYRYFEVGTKHLKKGTKDSNLLFIKTNGQIEGKSPGGTKTYNIVQIRKNKL